MPFDHRRQNTLTNKPPRRRQPSDIGFDDAAHGHAPAPTSAARRAAEAAFAAPAQDLAPASAHQAQITVRRSRLARDDAGTAAAAVVAAESEAKGPRVFRVDAAIGLHPPDTRNDTRDDTPAESASADVRTLSYRTPRTRRIASDKRPSPVVHVLQALQPVPARDPALDPRLHGMGQALAPVGRLLDEIARAQAFRFDDAGFANEWRALLRRVAALRSALQALLN